MKKIVQYRIWFVALAAVGLLAGLACTKEVVKEVPVEVVVEKEVVKEVVVEKPVIVEKEVVKEVVVEKPVIVEVEKVVQVEVVKEVEVQVGGPQGHVRIAASGQGKVSGWTSNCGGECYHHGLQSVGEPILQGARDAWGNHVYRPKVAESWTFNAAGGYTDFKIKKGNYFHKGWGEVTAADVAYTSNEGDPRCASQKSKDEANPIRHSGLPDPDYGCWEVMDKYTLRQPWTIGHPGVRNMWEITDSTYSWSVLSKRVYEEMGWEFARDNMILSGPYEYEVTDDTGWTTVARQDGLEDEQIPFVNRWSFELVPEYAVQKALLEAGQAHIGYATGDDIKRFLDMPHIRPLGTETGGQNVHWGGTYWETKHPVTGEPLIRTHREEFPWICAPGLDPLKPEATPCNDVAKKFRKALFMAVPRQDIVDAFLGGLGWPILSPIAHSGDPILKKYGDKWGYAEDTEKAKALFEEWKADYRAMGKDPDAVVLQSWVGTQPPRDILTEALFTHWAEVFGLDWELDTTPQQAFRPAHWRGRGSYHLLIVGAPTHRQLQMQWDTEAWYTALNFPGGLNVGYELPIHSQTILAKNLAWDDPAEQERLTVANRDYLMEQQIHTGLYEKNPLGTVYNSDVIASWPPQHGMTWLGWDFEYVTLRGR